MAQIGFPLMLGHIACFLISLFFLFEQMFITAIAKWLPSSLVITGFWVQSWISGSWTRFPQMPRARCCRDSQCPAPVSGCAMRCALRSSQELLLKHFVHLDFSFYADFLYWTEPLKTMFFLKKCHCWPCSFCLSLKRLCCGEQGCEIACSLSSSAIGLSVFPRAITVQPCRGIRTILRSA